MARARGAVVPMGSLLSVMAMTVAVKVPGVLEGAAVKVKTEWPGDCRIRG